MKLYFYNSKKEEVFKMSTSQELSRCAVKEIINCISDNLNLTLHIKQIVIDVINGNQLYTVVRQYYKSQPIEFTVTDRISYSCDTINDSIIKYINSFNDILYYFNHYNKLIIVIKNKEYEVVSAVYGNELLIDLIEVK